MNDVENYKKNRYDGELKLSISNDICRAKWTISLLERKILFVFFQELHLGGGIETLHIIKEDLFQILNLTSNYKKSKCKKICEEFVNKQIWISKNEKPIPVPIIGFEWKPKEPYFVIELNPDILPYFIPFYPLIVN